MGNLFWEYLFYGFCGFLLEVAFAKATHAAKQDRKCHLLLPVCPVYGVGALGLLALPSWVKASPLLLFFAAVAVCSLAEWCLSLFYERAVGVRFWDYRALPLNLGGRVCLLFSFCWGLLALPLVYRVAPPVTRLIAALPDFLTLPTAALYGADALVSLHLLRQGGAEALRWYVRLRPSEAR